MSEHEFAFDSCPQMTGTIIFHSIENGAEMLKITPDAFYVRGERLVQDDAEARAVYEAFVSWLRTTGMPR